MLQASHQGHNLSMNMDYTLTAISDLLRSLGFVWKIPVGGFRRWVLCKHNRGGATVAFNSSYCACACVRLLSIDTDTCTQRAQSDNSHKHIIIKTEKICSVQDKIYIYHNNKTLSSPSGKSYYTLWYRAIVISGRECQRVRVVDGCWCGSWGWSWGKLKLLGCFHETGHVDSCHQPWLTQGKTSR